MPGGPAPPLWPPRGTRDRGQRQPRRGKRPQAPPGLPAAHLRVSPPPSAPTVHPAGPGGGCSDAALTGPRAARPGLPAPGTHRVPASPRFLGSAGRQAGKEGEAQRRPPLPRREPPPELRLSAVLAGAGPARLPRPGSHFGSGGPVAITAQQLTRRRSGAGGSGGGGGARQGGSNRGGGGGARERMGGEEEEEPAKPRENCLETVPQECNFGLGPC